MPNSVIQMHWVWEEAFDKFGFTDGDGPLNYTEVVAEFIRGQGYTVEQALWSPHNPRIISVEREKGVNLLGDVEDPSGDMQYIRALLPAELVQALDAKFPENAPWTEGDVAA